MKYSVPLLLSAAFAAAAPAIEGATVLEKRQKATELSKGDCKDVTFIWVRGTTEAANLVSSASTQDIHKILSVISNGEPFLFRRNTGLTWYKGTNHRRQTRSRTPKGVHLPRS